MAAALTACKALQEVIFPALVAEIVLLRVGRRSVRSSVHHLPTVKMKSNQEEIREGVNKFYFFPAYFAGF